MDIIKAIQKRRSIRNFKAEQISEDVVHRLLSAATSAPTAANCQPWEFIVISDE